MVWRLQSSSCHQKVSGLKHQVRTRYSCLASVVLSYIVVFQLRVCIPFLAMTEDQLTSLSFPGQRGKENRMSKAYGRAPKRPSTVPARARPSIVVAKPETIVVAKPETNLVDLSENRSGLFGEPRRRESSAGGSVEQNGDALRSVERKGVASREPLSVERGRGDTLMGLPARLLSTSTPGPSASTPVLGRLVPAVPLVSPVPIGDGGISGVVGCASPELTGVASTGRRSPGSWRVSRSAERPPQSVDSRQTASVGDAPSPQPPSSSPAPCSPPPPQDEPEELSVPPVLSPGPLFELTPSLNVSLDVSLPPPALSPSLPLSTVPDGSRPTPVESPSTEGAPSSSPPRLDTSQLEVDLSQTAGYPVNMLPRCRSGVFSSDEEEEEEQRWTSAAEGTRAEEAAAVGSDEGLSASDAYVSPAAEARSDVSRFGDSELGVGLQQNVSVASSCDVGGSPQVRERSGSGSGAELFDSPKPDSGDAFPLSNSFVRLDRVSSDELRGAAENAGSVKAAEDAFEDPTASDANDETGDSQSSLASVAKMTECFVRLCRLELAKVDGIGLQETRTEAMSVEAQNCTQEVEAVDEPGETAAERQDSLLGVFKVEKSDLEVPELGVSDSEDPDLLTEAEPERTQADVRGSSVGAESQSGVQEGAAEAEEMGVDTADGSGGSEAQEPTEEEISLPSLTLPNSPEAGEDRIQIQCFCFAPSALPLVQMLFIPE